MLRTRDSWVRRLVERLDVSRDDANALSQAVQFVASLTDVPIEDYFLSNQKLCHAGQVVAAGGVGTRSQAGLFNPSTLVTDPVLGVVDWHAFGVSAIYIFREHITVLPQTLAGRFSDRQWGTAAGGVITQHSNNAAALAGTDGRFNSVVTALAATTFVLPLRYVLAPGTGFSWAPDADQVALAVGFQWREFDLRVR